MIEKIALAYVDITTGEFRASEITGRNLGYKLLGEINKISPKEIMTDEKGYAFLAKELESHRMKDGISLHRADNCKKQRKISDRIFWSSVFESFGIGNKDSVIKTASMVLKYVVELAKRKRTSCYKNSLQQQ